MGSKSAQNLTRMPKLLPDYVGYKLPLIFCRKVCEPAPRTQASATHARLQQFSKCGAAVQQGWRLSTFGASEDGPGTAPGQGGPLASLE